jgi:hypothetical protein
MILPEHISHGSIRSSSARQSIKGVTEDMSALIGSASARQEQQQRLAKLSNRVAALGATRNAAQWIAGRFSSPSMQQAA